ncbi:MAG: C-terminal binding protein [Methylobacteriaceae bacterium]|nr:C-terminal binding protein [Methylobacteriaceae bacterium]
MSDIRVAYTDSDQDMTLTETLMREKGIGFRLFQSKAPAEIIRDCQGMEVLVTQYARMTREVFDAVPSLKLVIRSGAGVDSVDLKAAAEHGVRVCNVPDGSTIEVAEHALALLLASARKIPFMNRKVHEGRWTYKDAVPLFRLRGSTVGVIGLGRIGTEFADMARGLGMKVLAHDRYVKELNDRQQFVELVDLDVLLQRSDYISVHCPLENNLNLLDREQFARMKSTCCLVNVSRGGVINEDALFEALSTNQIRGAAVDVSASEPNPPAARLMALDNYICTPHIGFYSVNSADDIATKVVEEVERFLKHEPLRCVVV